MAWIKPDTDIWILKGIPWSNDYHHTMWWTNSDYQYNYMVSKRKYILSLNTYQRVNDGTLRVNEPAEGLYECNYLMFRNHAYGDKWFYAFITDVQYINDGCCQITYEMDSMQTWFFECFGSDGTDIPTSWVVRCHSETDEPGDNLEAEPVQLNDYRYGMNTEIMVGGQSLTNLYYIVQLADSEEMADDRVGYIYEGIFMGATLHAFEYGGSQFPPNNLNSFLKKYVDKDKIDDVINIYCAPQALISSISSANDNLIYGPYDKALQFTEQLDEDPFNPEEDFDGYIPKNKKLYTYPFYFCTIFGPDGSNVIMRYEYCLNDNPEVIIYGSFIYPPCVNLHPIHYSESGNMTGYQAKYNMSLSLNNFPVCSWNVNSYDLWQAQNSKALISTGIKSAITIGGNALMGNEVGAAISGANLISDVASIAADSYTASVQADLTKGNASVGFPENVNNTNTFFYNKVKVSAQDAEKIDSYFTRYGYAQNRLMKPNLLSRKCFNYIRTVDMDVKGDISNTDKNKIESMFDNGFTAWHFDNPLVDDDFGNYDVDNSII